MRRCSSLRLNAIRPFVAIICLSLFASTTSAQELDADEANLERYQISNLKVGRHDWPQWGGTSLRNNTPVGTNIPTKWDIEKRENIRWSAKLGSQSYSCPVVANGKVFIGTNNNCGYVARHPASEDLGCLLCFDEKTGRFLWQHANEKLPSGRENDWPYMGVVSSAFADGDRVWYVSNRGEVVCLDANGFLDGENDGPYIDEPNNFNDEADVVWKFDMMSELGTRQHNMCTCSVTSLGDRLFVVTSNGVNESERILPAPDAPAFIALDRTTGQLLWTDNSPGENVLTGSWSSPACAVLGGQPQVLFPGGDCWLYSFDPAGDGSGKSKPLWKFDCNAKESKYILHGRGMRNEFITLPVIYDNRVYVATGQNSDYGEGPGCLWSIDPAKKLDGSDVSPTLAFDAVGNRLPPRRYQAVDRSRGEVEKPNPDCAAVWQFERFDLNGDGAIEYEEEMHRSCGPAAIKDDLLFIADFSGMVHCLDARTGKVHWNHDLLSASWAASPLIVDGKVYIGDEDGDVAIFELSSKKRLINEVFMGSSLYTTPIVANDVLYITTKHELFAISN